MSDDKIGGRVDKNEAGCKVVKVVEVGGLGGDETETGCKGVKVKDWGRIAELVSWERQRKGR